jgi:hypothetical protein
MQTSLRFLGVLAITGLLFACGSSGNDNPKVAVSSQPFTAVSSEVHNWQMTLRFGPDSTPSRGVDAVQWTIVDSNGSPIDGLDLSIVPFMPAMGHGTSTVPSTTETAPGVYLTDNVFFTMAGQWQLKVTFTGSASDSATVTFNVP